MTEYIIRYATVEDIPRIMAFVDENWKKGHILSRDRGLFEWQYINNGKLNMVVGETYEGDIQAILGFIPYSADDEKDFSLALWKAMDGTAFLGVKLLMFLIKEEPHRNIFCNGINLETTEGIYQRLGFKIGKLQQWYRLEKVEKYQIAKVIDDSIPKTVYDNGYTLGCIADLKDLLKCSSKRMFDRAAVPFKSKEYISKRYFNHPMYDYVVYGVYKNNKEIDTAIVFRIQECGDSRVLRIIDVIGDYSNIYLVTRQIDELAIEYKAEYVDLYEMGLSDDELYKAGWLKVGSNENIIPNYFAPFTQCNVDISISTMNEEIVIFKGDGDQDRPN